MKKKKFLSGFLAAVMTLSSFPISVFAEALPNETTSNITRGKSEAILTQEASIFDVTVPTALPINVDAHNNVTVATNATVINSSCGPIHIAGIKLIEKNSWKLVDEPTKRVGKKEVNFTVDTETRIIPSNSNARIIYDASISPQKSATNGIPVLDVVFTIGWDEYGSFSLSASKDALFIDDTSTLTVNGATESEVFRWKNGNNSVVILESENTTSVLNNSEDIIGSKEIRVRAVGVGKSTISVSDEVGNTVTKEIIVTDNLLENIYVDTLPEKTEYTEREIFDPKGMIIKAVYMNGDEYSLKQYNYSKEPLTSGQSFVTVEYSEKNIDKSVNVPITVSSKYRTITQIPSENGTFTVDKTEGVVGDKVTLEFSPNAGYKTDKIIINGELIEGNSFIMPDKDVSIEVTFVKIPYNIIKNPTSHGSFTLNKETASFDEEIEITVIPDKGYELDFIKVNGEKITENKFNMTEKNAIVDVAFKAISYTITKSVTTNGTFELDKTTATIGDKITITAKPSPKYRVSSIKVNNTIIEDLFFIVEDMDVIVSVEFEAAPEPAIGDKFEDETFEYRYGQEKTEAGIWINSSKTVGWGISLKNPAVSGKIPSPLADIKGYPVTNFRFLFKDASGATLDLSDWDTLNATDMGYMFYYATTPNINISGLDTSNVTDMSAMFYATRTTSIDLSSLNTSNVVTMNDMFGRAAMTSIDISSFNTSNVKNMRSLFYKTAAKNITLGNIDTSNVTNMSSMFHGTESLALNLSALDTSNVSTMNSMFYQSQAKTLDLSSFNTSNVLDMDHMFRDSKATILDLSTFDTSKVTSMNSIFYGAIATTGYAKNLAELTKFNTSPYKPTTLIFNLKPGTYPDVGTIYEDATFEYRYGQERYCITDKDFSPIIGWRTVPGQAGWGVSLKQGIDTTNIPSPATQIYGIPVVSLSALFYGFESSKTSLIDWDISNVKSTNSMFGRISNTSFFDISSLDISKVTDTDKMFFKATAFALIVKNEESKAKFISISKDALYVEFSLLNPTIGA